MARLRLVLILLLAVVLSLGVGLGLVWLVDHLPCHGEQLACNIDDAVGAYAVIIWAALGLIAFGAALLFARKRAALIGAALILLLPLIVFIGGDQIEGWRYVGFYPYPNFRSVLAMFGPPAAVVLVQYLIMRFAVGPTRVAGP